MESKKLLIKNIKGLYLAQENIAAPLKGSSMHNLPLIKNAFLAIEDDLIVGYGSMDDWEGISNWNNLEIIDADDQFVLPTFCDSHSHLVFAKSREGEFEDRINGLSYEEIATIMECPVGTVRSRIFRARDAIDKKIRPLLQQSN